MEVSPGYKQTEVGVIPDEWQVRRLATVSTKITDGDHLTPKRSAHGFYLLSARNVLNGEIDVSDVDYVATDEYERMKSRCGPEPGDVLISCSGTIGRVAVVPPHFQCVLVRSAALVKPCPSIVDGPFLQYWLQGSQAQAQIQASVNQGAQPNLFLNHIERLVCVVPSLAEQQALAKALSDADRLLGALDRLIAKKRDLKQAAMQQLLTGMIRLPGFKGAWGARTLGDLFDFGGGYSASRDRLSTAGYCYLHYGDIHKSTKSFIDATLEYGNIPKLNVPLARVSPCSLLADGDVVFVDASEDDEGTSKHVVVVNKEHVPFISGLHTIVAKGKTGELTHEYRRHCFQPPAIRKQFLYYAVGTKVTGISKTNIARLTMPVPSAPEQLAIAEILSDMDAELATLEARREKTRGLKQAMMQELLTGRTRLV